ncbi:hypothetical protein, unlikely [Trypanosoma brucei gambiense DAL972]|uniref:Uncharacterized protein n=1 Tax=Trypanosoma brucei gambiense (strain MHOM/CI/86/DAL972) TaxID=679716 RepID=C9ZNE3_TRYB9|nr:hypothetical protein, unlikely [Trypanosoma brucei gambiense DAL972]CBH10921.1 hypothetical protein, unlikely [Trypanosoma brucei gambiense DAL972]|eukprot:XP_011773208.1 hypothetical protein, unlikely [Trypanosoma brucei gambiense DAL972]
MGATNSYGHPFTQNCTICTRGVLSCIGPLHAPYTNTLRTFCVSSCQMPGISMLHSIGMRCKYVSISPSCNLSRKRTCCNAMPHPTRRSAQPYRYLTFFLYGYCLTHPLFKEKRQQNNTARAEPRRTATTAAQR